MIIHPLMLYVFLHFKDPILPCTKFYESPQTDFKRNNNTKVSDRIKTCYIIFKIGGRFHKERR